MKQVKALVEAYINLSSIEEKTEFWYGVVCSMSVLELMTVATALKDAFGITLPTPTPTATRPPVEVAEEQTEFNVVLKSFGPQKVQVIKVVRKLTGLGLRQSKELVESAPTEVEKEVSKEEAQSTKAQLEEVGAVVEIV